MTQVRLIALTEPKIPEDKTAEELVVFAARVSNPSNQTNMLTGPKLLKYLVKHQHWSPLELAHAVLEIETTRDVSRQIIRHRSFSFQEYSGRYADPTQDLGIELREARYQDLKNRQSSIDLDFNNDQDRLVAYQWEQLQKQVSEVAINAYNWAASKNIAKEQRRAVLPEGLLKTRLYMSGSLRSWIHYIQLRTDMSTQKEHREVAEQCLQVLKAHCPELMQLLDETT